MRLAILTSHPIQYQAPFFRKLAAVPQIDIIVIFRKKNRENYFDEGFDRKVVWDLPLLDGYSSIFLKNPWSINSVLRKKKVEILIVYGWNSFTNWWAALSALQLNIPFFVYGENPLQQEFVKTGPPEQLRRWFLQTLFKKAAGCFYIGKENKKFYEHFGVPERKLFSMPYSVDNERFFREATRNKRPAFAPSFAKGYGGQGKAAAGKQKTRRGLGILENAVVILFVGKLIPKKRPLDLLEAYKSLNSSALALVFVGDGTLRNELEEYCKEHNLKNVHFVGFKNQTELSDYYAVADIFVLPSGAGETWGLVVNEAMCFGLPVVVSSVVGCGPDLIHEGKNGYIFQVGDVRALSGYLALLIKNKSTRRNFGVESLKIIRNYNYEKDLEGMSEAFRRIGLLGI